MLRSVKSQQRLVRTLYFEILNTAGTLSLASGTQAGTLVDNGGSGDFTITLTNPGTRLLAVYGALEDQSGSVTVNSASTATAIQIEMFDDAGAGVDTNAYVTIVVSDATDET